jgi:hypothetical protein
MKARDPLDLSRDNRIRALLEAREKQLAIIRRAEALKREAEAEIREKMGRAEEAFTEGWTIEIKTVRRREFIMPAVTYRVLRARRLEPIEEPGRLGTAVMRSQEQAATSRQRAERKTRQRAR